MNIFLPTIILVLQLLAKRLPIFQDSDIIQVWPTIDMPGAVTSICKLHKV